MGASGHGARAIARDPRQFAPVGRLLRDRWPWLGSSRHAARFLDGATRSQNLACVLDGTGRRRPRFLFQHARHKFAEREEVRLARRRASPGEAHGSSGLRRSEAQKLNAFVTHFDIDRDFRNQRQPIAVRDHLHHCRKRRCAQAQRHLLSRGSAISERLIAQAMPLFKQNEPLLIDVARINARIARQWIVGRHREQERIVEQPDAFDLGVRQRQRQHHRIEIAAAEFFEQNLGLGFAQLDEQIRIIGLQIRQHLRQHIGRQGRNDAEPQPARQRTAAMAGEIGEVARGGEHSFGPAHDLGANLGQGDFARSPLD